MNPQTPNHGSTARGLGIGCGLAVALAIALLLLQQFQVLLFVGLIQLAYIIPLFLRFRKAGEDRTVIGIIIAASIVALLNAMCGALSYH
jgi:hypothetical protein